VKIAVVDCAEEDENENEKVPERTAVLLDLYLDHVLPSRRFLGHILHRHPVQRLLASVPVNAGEEETIPNANAKNSTADLCQKETTSTRKTNFRRINGRFLSLSWS
jgi:hypothetical protein